MLTTLKSPNFILALIFVVSILALFFIIIWRQLGGTEALFLIIGHVAAWVEFIVFYFWRKNPSAAKPPVPGS